MLTEKLEFKNIITVELCINEFYMFLTQIRFMEDNISNPLYLIKHGIIENFPYFQEKHVI